MSRNPVVALAVALLAASATADLASARVIDCDDSAFGANVIISSARNMSCHRAVRDIRRYRSSINRRFRTPGGFACAQQSGTRFGGQWRCVNGSRPYRFEFAD